MTIDSIFVDADLLRTIPSGWNLLRLKDVIEQFISGGTPESGNDAYWTDDEDGIPWVAISDMTRSSIIISTEKKITEAGLIDKQLALLPKGTLLFSIYASLGQLAFLEIPATTNQAILGLITSDKILAKYLRYWLNLIKPLLPALSSSNTQNNLNAEKVRNIPILVPTLFEQHAIVNYLDRETTRIDSLIATKERLLELLAEKRRAVITHAATRGLNADVSLRDSGVEWLGEIPKHWRIAKMKNVCNSLQTGPFGSQLHAEDYIDNGIPYINPAHLGNGKIYPNNKITVDEATAERLSIHKLEKGDIVLARRGEIGRCGLVTEHEVGWLCGSGSLRIRPMMMWVNPQYLVLLLTNTFVGATLSMMSVGTTMDNLNTEIVGGLIFPLPPIDEQQRIVEYLEVETTKIDNLTYSTQKTIDLLYERRASLIAATVSGQIPDGVIMQLQKLSLTNFRAFKQAEFEFKPGMNLIVGINGVGKSSVLDAIRLMMSQTLPKFTPSRSRPIPFEFDDINVDQNSLVAELRFEVEGIEFNYLAQKSREEFSKGTKPEIRDDQFSQHVDRKKRIQLRHKNLDGFNLPERYELTPDDENIIGKLRDRNQSLAIFFSTRRSLAMENAPSKSKSEGGQSVAYAEALYPRELRLREFAEWWQVQKILGQETKKAVFGRHMEILDETVTRFLGNVRNLRVDDDDNKLSLIVDKEGATLEVKQLSDGERGLLSIVLDLARRMAQANPHLSDPLRESKAVILIDELDLHLHPRWQRDVVEKLTKTFPNSQFIVTTHSPQIVGEVLPEKITLLEGDRQRNPNQSMGMDSNWILDVLMGTKDRDKNVMKKLDVIEKLIETRNFLEAKARIESLRLDIGDFPELAKLETRIHRIQTLGK